MKPGTRLLLALRKFFKKNWKVIVIVAVIWIGIIIINNYLKNRPKEITLTNTYNPDTPVIDSSESIPNNKKEEVNLLIDSFFNYCNTKQYQNAYNMLTEDCKNYMYSNSISEFMEYVDSIYTNTKIYNLQNYSNTEETYIYNITILDDIMSTGTTGGYQTYTEKIAIIDENGTLKISNQGYMGKESFGNLFSEDNYLKIKILNKNMSYKREEYEVEISNKTDGYILIGNGQTANEITLNLGDQTRPALDIVNNNILLAPGQTGTYYLLFDKYYDDGKEPKEMNFNLIRVYGNNEKLASEGLSANSEITYSMNISLTD